MIPQRIAKQRTKFTDAVVVGKDILELLSSAMYVDPLSIFREYIQNAADSLDQAIELGHFRNGQNPRIEVTIDPVTRSVIIRDNGTGISKSAFKRTLTSIAVSRKRGSAARGFRGVGRLSGLGYCQTLIMRSKSVDDTVVSCMHWDCRRLRELLRDPAELSLGEILHEIIETYPMETDGAPSHFFEVEMQGVVRCKNDILLNKDALERYLAQVAPVPFHPSFSFAKDIESFLVEHKISKTYKLAINETPVFRPFRDTYEARSNVHGKFTGLDFFKVPGLSTDIDALGWILQSDYLGAIPDRHGIEGLRLRVGNIQIGDSRLLDSRFPEPRFNAWTVGECHVVSQKITPNARRYDFEDTPHYSNLLGHLIPKAKEIAKACRECSLQRAKERQSLLSHVRDQNGPKIDWVNARTIISKQLEKPLSATHKKDFLKLLRNGNPTYYQVFNFLVNQNPNPNSNLTK